MFLLTNEPQSPVEEMLYLKKRPKNIKKKKKKKPNDTIHMTNLGSKLIKS